MRVYPILLYGIIIRLNYFYYVLIHFIILDINIICNIYSFTSYLYIDTISRCCYIGSIQTNTKDKTDEHGTQTHNQLQMREITGIGREPGRSRADRSVLTARRGRFSPFNLIDRSAFHAGRSVFRGRPLVLRHLYRLRTVVAVCLAGLVLFGSPVSTSVRRPPTGIRTGAAGAADSSGAGTAGSGAASA